MGLSQCFPPMSRDVFEALIPAFHRIVCLGKAHSLPLPSLLQLHTGSGGTHTELRRLQVLTHIR